MFPQLLGSLIGGGLQQNFDARSGMHQSAGQGATQSQPQDGEWPRPGSAPAPGTTPTSPLQEGPFRMGGTSRGGIRIMTTSGFGGHTTTTHQNLGADDLLGILSSIVTGIGGTTTQGNPSGRPSGAPSPFNFLAQMLDLALQFLALLVETIVLIHVFTLISKFFSQFRVDVGIRASADDHDTATKKLAVSMNDAEDQLEL